MTRLVAIFVTLFLVSTPAKADVALWPRPIPGWTVILVYGRINAGDLATFESYTENVNPDTTLVIVTGPGGDLVAGFGMGVRVHLKKLIVGVMGTCTSSCALIWIGGETGRKFFLSAPTGCVDISLLPPSLTKSRAGPVWSRGVAPVCFWERIHRRISHQTGL